MVLLTLNTLTLIMNLNHLMEWVYSLRDGYIWGLSQLLMGKALGILSVK
jgi:hypothetical protein